MENRRKTTQPLQQTNNAAPVDEQNRYQKLLFEFSSEIRQSDDIESVLRLTLKTICETCGLPDAKINIQMPVSTTNLLNTRDLDTKDLRP